MSLPTINTPPLRSALAVSDDKAEFGKPWGNWLTQVWQRLAYFTLSPVRTVTAAYVAELTDAVILINGNITVTLPKAYEAEGKRITCKAINAGGGTRTVSGNGANIDGAATWTTTTQYAVQDFVSDGTQWWTA